MQKIMFDDRFGLTEAVLDGRKTMTRRFAEKVLVEDEDGFLKWNGEFEKPRYKVGEVVAVAQSYSELSWDARFYERLCSMCERLPQYELAGWDNKMFVRADLMPHHIRITSVRIERLQDISNEDCMREGVRKLESQNCPTMFTFDGWSFKNKVNRCTDSPKEAFEALFKKLSGKKAWDDNPWVFVYEFELVK